jgi:hypothetical protein
MASRQLRPPPESVQLRAHGYCRVSTDQQRDSGISLDEQQRKIEARRMRHTTNPKSNINGMLLSVAGRHVATMITGTTSDIARTMSSGIVKARFFCSRSRRTKRTALVSKGMS